ncbi:hypothetical protein [Rickettsia oklahomensis]|uniref:Uncharacterized protein n=1 Tax=Rickettsia oklahomensis TaxID=3141789 RepID=A0AAU7BYX8_9RICK
MTVIKRFEYKYWIVNMKTTPTPKDQNINNSSDCICMQSLELLEILKKLRIHLQSL